jgi:hypothetical protein
MVTSQTRINKSEFFSATRNKKQAATIIILQTADILFFIDGYKHCIFEWQHITLILMSTVQLL